MPVTWTLKVGTVEKPLSGWGVETSSLRRTLRSLDVDELSFTCAAADLLTDPPMAYGDIVSLRRNGVQYFKGRLIRSVAAGDAHGERNQITVAGPWWDLAHLVYEQPRVIKSDDFTHLLSVDTTRVILGQNSLGVHITTGQQITDIITYALARGAALVLPGSTPSFVTAPLDEARDITCAEAIRRMLAFTPDAVSWFDYTADTPILNIQRRDFLADLSYSVNAGLSIESVNITDRRDLVPPGVRLNFITSAKDPISGIVYAKVTTQTVGVPIGIGVVVATIDLMGAGTDSQEDPPSGLASAYYTALQAIQYQGSLRFHAFDCAGDITPAKRLSLSGGRSAWSAMRALVQIVTEDLGTGVTSVEFGPPEHLGVQDFVNQLMFNRKVGRPPEPTNFNAVKDSDPDNPNPAAGKDPKNYTAEKTGESSAQGLHTIPVVFCDPATGAERTIAVYTPEQV
jgi:hypothetical protein